MNNKRQIIPVAGLLGTAGLAVYMVTQLHAQATLPTGDFRNATVAEVQDGQGQVVLRGEFALAAEQDEDDVERKADLRPAGSDPDAAGKAEIEFSQNAASVQEIEFSVRNLAPGTPVTFLIDGQVIGQASADRRGRAELEIDVRTSAAASR